MTIQQIEKNGTHIAWIPEKELLITDDGRSFFFVPTKEEAVEKLCQ